MIEGASLWELIGARANASPNARFAVDEDDRELSFGQYRDALLRCAAGLHGRGVREGSFAPNDVWETANILWTLANGIIQSELSPLRRQLRGRALESVFEDAIDLFLRGLARKD